MHCDDQCGVPLGLRLGLGLGLVIRIRVMIRVRVRVIVYRELKAMASNPSANFGLDATAADHIVKCRLKRR